MYTFTHTFFDSIFSNKDRNSTKDELPIVFVIPLPWILPAK